jgi:hypothetical protein
MLESRASGEAGDLKEFPEQMAVGLNGLIERRKVVDLTSVHH